MIYSQDLCLGIVVNDYVEFHPANMTYEQWMDEYKGFWPSYLEKFKHPAIFMSYTMRGEQTLVIYGVRAEYYFEHYPSMSYSQFKGKLAREIGKLMRLSITAEDISYYPTTFILESEEDE